MEGDALISTPLASARGGLHSSDERPDRDVDGSRLTGSTLAHDFADGIATISPKPSPTVSHSRDTSNGTQSDFSDVQAHLLPHSELSSSEKKTISVDSRHPDRHVEWIPMMLRPVPAALLIAYCVGLITGLELLNNLPTTRNGIATTNRTAVQATTYLPIVLVVLLGISWKRLIVDLKRIVPWACLSRRWTLGRDSLELNYLDNVELSLIWPSARRRHWALLIGLLGGLLSGGLVPLATALTFVDLDGESVRPVLVRHDTFDFNSTLSTSNASLSLLKSVMGNMPWAGAANILQSDGSSPAWTTESFVFAPFAASGTNLTNHTITANTTAITARLVCDALQVNTSVNVDSAGYSNDEYGLVIRSHTKVYISLANTSNPSGLDLQTVIKDPDSVIDPPVAWLNLSATQWSPTSLKTEAMRLTLLQPILRSGPRLYWNGTTSLTSLWDAQDVRVPVRAYRGVGLSCTPMFYSYVARVSVNASSGVVSHYTLDHATSRPLDIMLSTPDMIGYLNNPLHPDTIFGISGSNENVEKQDVIQLGAGGDPLASYYTSLSGSDPFGTQLLDLATRPVADYFNDPSLLQTDASRVFATTMTQVIKAFAVVDGTRTSIGQTESVESLLKIQSLILRVLETTLAILGIILLCCAWPLRPRTCLSEDPGSLHFIASLVAQNRALDVAFPIYKQTVNNICRHSHFRLRQEEGPVMHLDIAPVGSSVHKTMPYSSTAYQPLQLRLIARVGILILLTLYIVALGVLYSCGVDNGYLASTKGMQIAWSFVPTTLLVLIGYAVSGVVLAVQAIAPLAIMKTERLTGRRVMRFSPRNRSELTLPYHAAFKRLYIPVLLTAVVALAFPVVKILAADLYEAFESPYVRTCTLQTSPMVFDFGRLAQTDGGTESRLRNTAAIRTDWIQLPASGVQSQPNVVRNLVFQNASVLAGTEGAEGRLAKSELTALAVHMTCDLFSPDAWNLSVRRRVEYPVSESTGGSIETEFRLDCGTADCQKKIPPEYKGTDQDGPLVHAARTSNWDYLYAADPYAVSNRRFYGWAGNMLTSPTIQVMVADFGSIAGPVSNLTYIPDGPDSIPAFPGMFNVSNPTMRAVSCTPILQNVRVSAVLERRVLAGLDGQSTVLPWAVTDFDPSSLRVIDDVNVTDDQVWRKLFPKGTVWGYSPFMNRDWTLVDTNWTNESELNDDDMRPASCIASNFFELLASYEQSQGRDAKAVLDVNELASATTAVYGLYNAELLSHFRVSRPMSTQNGSEVQLHTTQVRVRPNPETTFAVLGILSVILLLLLAIFFTTASEHVLLDKPGKIATQLSLFAGSNVVERLRGPDPDSVWDEKFSLGWWKAKGLDEDGRERFRWGIDIGKLDSTLQGYWKWVGKR